MKALRKVPEARYPTVAALADDVRRCAARRAAGVGGAAMRGAIRRRSCYAGMAPRYGIAAGGDRRDRHHRGDASRSANAGHRHGDPARQSATRPSVARGGLHQSLATSGRCMAVHRDGRDVAHRLAATASAGRCRPSGPRANRELGPGLRSLTTHTIACAVRWRRSTVVVGSLATSGERRPAACAIDVKGCGRTAIRWPCRARAATRNSSRDGVGRPRPS